MPLAEYVYGRTVRVSGNGATTHLLDVYVYHHTGPDALRCLALSESGGVYEGSVTVPEQNALQIDLTGYENDTTVSRVVRLDFKDNNSLRQRVWSLDDNERTLVLDLLHHKFRS